MITGVGVALTNERRLRHYYQDGPTWDEAATFREWTDVAEFVQWNTVREL
jgi:hypothetical protein